MTGKQLSRVGITCARGVPHTDDGVLDIGVPQAILHEGDIGPSVEQMDRDRMPTLIVTLLILRR